MFDVSSEGELPDNISSRREQSECSLGVQLTDSSGTKYGALKSPDDPNDNIFEHLAKAAPSGYFVLMPEEFDLRTFAQPSRNQGERGTCAAFAAATIKEIQENRDCGFDEHMSAEFVYFHRENKPASGMYGRNVLQILQRIGSVPEGAYPYYDTDQDPIDLPEPSQRLYNIAAKYRIANFARVTSIDGLKRALLELGPCLMQLPLYSHRPQFWRQKGDEINNGGHAVAVVGYNKQGFVLKNSWGSTWNGNGCVIFPYDEWGIQWECWVSVDERTEKIVPLMSSDAGQYTIPIKKSRRNVCTIF